MPAGGGMQMPRLGGGGAGGGGLPSLGAGSGLPRSRASRPPGGGRADGVPGDLPVLGGPASFGEWSPRQIEVARLTVAEAMRRHLPARAAEIAVATEMQESRMRVLANPGVPESMRIPHDGTGTDHDSVGPLQQRQSWGATADLMNPVTSAGKFYDKLVRIPNWQSLPLTVAAQKVQVSATPTAYAQWEGKATALVRAILGG